MQDFLITQAKLEQLLMKLYPVLKKYPRSEMYSLTSRTKEAFYEAIKHLAVGSSVPSRRFVEYQNADSHLKILKLLIRVAYKNQYISKPLYQATDLDLTEIEKMTNTMIKNCRKT